jgi:hypothetical protein
LVALERADIRFLRTLPTDLTDLFFFRHREGAPGIQNGAKFEVSYFSKWWKRASGELGIEAFTLYPSTRHTIVTSVCGVLSPEERRPTWADLSIQPTRHSGVTWCTTGMKIGNSDGLTTNCKSDHIKEVKNFVQ